MELYIVRHGQTDGNKDRIMDGIRDIDLNETGIKQANTTKEKLKDINFDLVICSPLIRTKHTMEIITDNKYPVIYDDRIMERDCGEYTGISFDLVDRDLYWNYYDKTEFISAESIPVFFKRVYDFLEDIKIKYKDKKVLLVTHKGVTRAIKCYYDGIPEDGNLLNIGFDNCEVKNIYYR